jgi:hypothetical protein
MNGQDGLGQPRLWGRQAPALLRPRRHQNQSHRNPKRHFREPMNAIGHAGPVFRINITTATVIPRNPRITTGAGHHAQICEPESY